MTDTFTFTLFSQGHSVSDSLGDRQGEPASACTSPVKRNQPSPDTERPSADDNADKKVLYFATKLYIPEFSPFIPQSKQCHINHLL